MKPLRMIIIGILLISTGILSAAPVQAAEQNEARELNIDDAVSLGLAYSRDYKKAQLSKELAEIDYEDASDDWVDYDSVVSWEHHDEEDQVYQYYTSFLNADYSYRYSQLNEDMMEDQVKYNVRAKYYNILQAVADFEYAQLQLSLQEQDNRLAQANYRVGRLSSVELQESNLQLENQKSSLITAQNNLDDAYYGFNLLVGLKPADRPVLTEEPQLETFEVENVESTIRAIADNTPEQWLKEKSLTLQEKLNLYSSDEEKSDIELQMTSMEISELREKTIQTLTNTYQNIKSIEQQAKQAKTNLTLAETKLRQAEMNYQVGRGTRVDVISAQKDIIQAEQNLLKLNCQHDLLRINFTRPWTM